MDRDVLILRGAEFESAFTWGSVDYGIILTSFSIHSDCTLTEDHVVKSGGFQGSSEKYLGTLYLLYPFVPDDVYVVDGVAHQNTPSITSWCLW